ncbi:MAG: NHL domain-containing protein [Gaiellaceae bacterium]
MRPIAIVVAALVATVVATAGVADRPGALLNGKVPALDTGSAWNAKFTLLRRGRPLAGARPRFWIRGTGVSRSFASRGIGRGRYSTRVSFPSPGTYRFSISIEEFSVRLGSAVVQPGLRRPIGLAVGPDGGVYVADGLGTTVVRIDPQTKRRTVAASGLQHPVYLTFDAQGRMLVVDELNRIYRFDAAGAKTLVAGTGQRAHTGDGGPAATAALGGAGGMDVDRNGNLIVAEYDGWIRVIRPNGTIGSLAGNGTEGYSGDGGPAAQAVVRHPHDVAVLTDDSLVIADSHNNALRRIGDDGRITTVATGVGAPVGVAPMPSGGFVVADGNGPIIHVRANGQTSTVATVNIPFGIATSTQGDIYVTELEAHRVKRVDSGTGKVTTLVP